MATEQVIPGTQRASTPQRFYKVQLKAWTAFDPTTMDLAGIAEHIERGAGFLTAIEVVKVADNVSAVDDLEVRERFETVLAVEKIVENIGDIPQQLRDRLNAALSTSRDEKKPAQDSNKGDNSRLAA